ncbi:uncharacterized protein LOC112055357 [Bicyclus anynana]|uniref:Uncharacterized protein LOC112055357 n=1 Tax=Bicyclus anynana TaxID=110368 RepID=A0A6J1P3C8_BICAN|nr:uncharacterized protein LOC112055357 [Bicyclus anynana]
MSGVNVSEWQCRTRLSSQKRAGGARSATCASSRACRIDAVAARAGSRAPRVRFSVRATVAARCITVRRHSAREPAPSARERVPAHTRASRALYVTRDHRALSRPDDPLTGLECYTFVVLRFGFGFWLCRRRSGGGGPAVGRRSRSGIADVARASRRQRGARAACSQRGHHPARPLDTQHCTIIRSDMKNLAPLLAVPISEYVVTFISLLAAATLLSWTTEGRSARRWSAGERGRRVHCRALSLPHTPAHSLLAAIDIVCVVCRRALRP